MQKVVHHHVFLKSSNELLEKESIRLSNEGVKCPSKSLSLSYLNGLRISNKVDKAIACYVRYLDQNKDSGWHWSGLGQSYLNKGNTKFTSLANNCFKQAAKLSGKLYASIKEWHFLGPFVIGKNEVDGDPVQFYGNIMNVAKSRFDKKKTKFFSEIVSGGEVQWEVIKQENTADFVEISPKINWNDLVGSLGSTGITEWQGWVVSEFAVNDNNVNVIIQCLGVHTMYINKTPVTGDVYRRNQFWFSVLLSKGIQTIYIHLRAKGSQMFKCNFAIAKSNFEVLKPHFMPDLWDGKLFSNYIALPISNLHSSKWLKIIKISIQEQSQGNPIKAKLFDNKVSTVAPGQTKPIAIELSSETDTILEKFCQPIDLKLKLSTSDGQVVYPLTLRCRKKRESFIFTFQDHDGSLQHAAAIHPIKSCEGKWCAVLLTLHGTTVPAQNQADSYKRMENSEFVFGVDKAWVLAPTRHGAHNWEGPGALTAMTSLQALCDLIKSKTWISEKASVDYIIFAGHSMGGHGAWHLATHFPDKALALMSLAGWIKKEEYGDSNLFFRHDIANSHVDSAVKHIMEACITENEADRFVSNLQGVPVIARIGANDRTIHPYFVRRMYRILKEWNINVTYVELPGKEHWWWDTLTTNDGGCMNDKQLQEFTNKYSIIPNNDVTSESPHNMYSEASQEDRYFTYIVINPAFGGTFKGMKIIQQIIPYRISRINIIVSVHKVKLTTENVAAFTIKEPNNRPVGWHNFVIEIDGTNVDEKLVSNIGHDHQLCLQQQKGGWHSCSNGFNGRQLNTLGPSRRVAESKFVIVTAIVDTKMISQLIKMGTGTQSSERITQALLEMAVYIANLFFLTSDTIAPVIKDIDLSETDAKDYNLIVIGSPSENLHSNYTLQKLPLTVNSDGIAIGNCIYSDRHTGLLALAPHDNNKLALVLLGNSLNGLHDVVSLATPTIPPMTRSPFSNMVPDYVITGPEFPAKGPGGYRCAGFWDNSWKFNSILTSCSYCLI